MSKEYDPEVIASSFIKQFYETLSKNPSELHRFYKDESYFTHCDHKQQVSPISGIENIRQKILDLNLAGSKVDLSEGSLDAHRSEGNGVIMVATGLFTPNDSITSSPFVQTFFLSSQKTASYFVRNSVFRIVGEAISNKVVNNSKNQNLNDMSNEYISNQPETSHPTVNIDYNQQNFTADIYEQGEEVRSKEDQKPDVVDLVEEEAKVSEEKVEEQDEIFKETVSVAQEVFIEESPSHNEHKTIDIEKAKPVVAPVETSVNNSKPKSFIEALKSKQAAAAAEVANKIKPSEVTNKIKPSVPASVAVTNHQLPPAPTNSASSPSFTSNLPPVTSNANSRTFRRSSDERVRHSVYVRHVTEKITEADIRTLFSQFGDVMNVDLRGQKGFAFVEFETMQMVHRALEHKEALMVGDQSLFIQERTSSMNSKANNTSSNNNNTGNSRGSRRRQTTSNEAEESVDKEKLSSKQSHPQRNHRSRNRHNYDRSNDNHSANEINNSKGNNNKSTNKETQSIEETTHN